MEKEHKDLLLKELSARMPYGVKVICKIPVNQNENKEIVGQVTSVHYNIDIVQVEGFDVIVGYSPHFEIKPYLFPLSSMTEEQKIEYKKACKLDMEILSKHPLDGTPFPALYNSQDWLNKNNFDYRGLIPMGLANDASGLNIY